MGSPAGLLLATGVFGAVSLLPEDQFLAWGWRIPFLLSALLIAVGLFVRLTIAETPAFARVKGAKARERMPILEVIRSNPKSLLLAFGAFASELFGTKVRYSGASLGYQLSAAIAGGLTPFIATAMVAAAGGGYWPVPAYLAALGLISLLSMYLALETYRSDLSGQAAAAERRVATGEAR